MSAVELQACSAMILVSKSPLQCRRTLSRSQSIFSLFCMLFVELSGKGEISMDANREPLFRRLPILGVWLCTFGV